MHASLFFKLFPPPKFMTMRYAGLDISDDAIHSIQYAAHAKHMSIASYDSIDLPQGLVQGGDIKDEKQFAEILSAFAKKNKLSYVKVSLPEEKAYLFQTDVPNTDMRAIEQNIEFKLEQNVPLAAPDAVFYFDLLPTPHASEVLHASVTVVPRAHVEYYSSILATAGMIPVSFEVVPKSIARAVVPHLADETYIIINMMASKTGIYLVSAGVVSFTSTLSRGSREEAGATGETYPTTLAKEINRVYSYWMSRPNSSPINQIVLAGRDAPQYESALQNVIAGSAVQVKVADIWQNVFNLDAYVPPISKEDSLDFAVAAGLGLNL